MKIEKIELVNFRNYQKKSRELGQVTVVKGDNGAGKSNFMEAVYLLATGKSFRADVEGDMIFRLKYDKSVISEERLKQYADEEVAAGSTLVGPHRDDFEVEQENGEPGVYRDISKYGSRGQQRMAVLWIKLGERDFLTAV